MNGKAPSHLKYVVIEGNIGSGKTTLTKMLAEYWNARTVLEQFSDNPFLPKFYEDPTRHAFPLEMSFLAERYHQHRNELSGQELFQPISICDYSFGKSLVFAGINLPPDEFELYRTLFHIIHGRLPRPDLLIYLHCSEEKSLRQIKERGRPYEQDITLDYLRRISNGYREFLHQTERTTIVIVDTEDIDFKEDPSHFLRLHKAFSVPRKHGVHRLDVLSA